MNYNFDGNIAKVIGIREALIISAFSAQMDWNQATKDKSAFHDNKHWVTITLGNMSGIFPFWTKRQIQLGIDNLVRLGLIEKEHSKKENLNGPTRYTVVKGKQFNEILKKIKPGKRIRSESRELKEKESSSLNNPFFKEKEKKLRVFDQD